MPLVLLAAPAHGLLPSLLLLIAATSASRLQQVAGIHDPAVLSRALHRATKLLAVVRPVAERNSLRRADLQAD